MRSSIFSFTVKWCREVREIAVRPDGQFALLQAEEVSLYRLDDTLVGRFSTTPPAWQLATQRLAERAASLDQASGAEAWLEVYPFADELQQEQIESWIVEHWPSAEPFLDEGLWRTLAIRLCRAHPTAASYRALERFERSPEARRPDWLETLTYCHSQAPPGVLEYAQGLAGSRDPVHRKIGERALAVWSPDAQVERMWITLMEEPSCNAGRELIQVWSKSGPLFENAILGADPTERQIARAVVLESMLWGPAAEGPVAAPGSDG